MKKFLIVMALVMLCCGLANSQGYKPADIMWIVDGSGSMNTELLWLKDKAGTFFSGFQNAGIDVRMGVITYLSTPNLDQPLTSDSATFVAGIPTTGSGGIQNGYQALDAAMSGGTYDLSVNWRTGATRVLILVTDEDADDYTASWQTELENALDARPYLLNVIYDSTFNNAQRDYDPLARPSNALYDLQYLRDYPDQFTTEFINNKVEEIIHGLPIVTQLGLIALVILLIGSGVLLLRRRKPVKV